LDSVIIEADVEMGGSDQLFNNLVGRNFKRKRARRAGGNRDAAAGGTDGAKKMSKSLGNYIAVTDPPSGQEGCFGKVMSLPDNLMEMYYTLLTDLPESEFKDLIRERPRDAKIKLAKHIITWLHNKEAADAAEAEFIKVFSKKEMPDEMPEVVVGAGPHKIAALIVKAGLASSNSDAIRKIRKAP